MRPISLRPLAPLGTAVFAASALLASAALAQAPAPNAPGPVVIEPAPAQNPVDGFTRSLEDVKTRLGALNQGLADGAKQIGALTDPKGVRAELEALRAAAATALGLVADDSEVAQLGDKALAHAQAKLRQVEAETRFTAEQREFLAREWRQIGTDTEKAGGDLERARREFAGLLRVLQTREDFVGELLELRRAREAIEIMQKLASEVRGASDSLKTLIRQMEGPKS